MIGSRPLTDTEIEVVLNNLKSIRDKAMFIVGLRCGFRISEILSLTIKNVMQYGEIANQITVERCNMKGKRSSRTVPLHEQAKQYLKEYLSIINVSNPETRLFPFTRQRGHNILKAAFNKAKLEGKTSTHSLRKTFANKVHVALGENIFKTQKAMGHANLSSTAHYISFMQEEIDNAILGV